MATMLRVSEISNAGLPSTRRRNSLVLDQARAARRTANAFQHAEGWHNESVTRGNKRAEVVIQSVRESMRQTVAPAFQRTHGGLLRLNVGESEFAAPMRRGGCGAQNFRARRRKTAPGIAEHNLYVVGAFSDSRVDEFLRVLRIDGRNLEAVFRTMPAGHRNGKPA
jgi:hypothetical protein